MGPRGLPLEAQQEPAERWGGWGGAGLRSQGRKPGRKGPGGDRGGLPRADNGGRLGVRLLFWKPVWTALVGPRAHREWVRAGAIGRMPGRAPMLQEGGDPRIVAEPGPRSPGRPPISPHPALSATPSRPALRGLCLASVGPNPQL